jgi:hypothetical protein
MSFIFTREGPELPDNAWSIYKHRYLPTYQNDFLDKNAEKLDMLALEFRMNLIRYILGERDSAVLHDHITNINEVKMEKMSCAEITLDRALDPEELMAFPRHFAVFVVCYFSRPHLSDFTFKKLHDTKKNFLGYQIYFEEDLLHTMSITENMILVDNLAVAEGFCTSYLEALRGTACLE